MSVDREDDYDEDWADPAVSASGHGLPAQGQPVGREENDDPDPDEEGMQLVVLVHCTDLLKPLPRMTHPRVRVCAVSGDEAAELVHATRKASHERWQTPAFPSTSSCRLTTTSSVQPQWEEALPLPVDWSQQLAEAADVVLLFELYDERRQLATAVDSAAQRSAWWPGSSLRQRGEGSEAGANGPEWHRHAFGFLRLHAHGPRAGAYLGERVRVQLYAAAPWQTRAQRRRASRQLAGPSEASDPFVQQWYIQAQRQAKQRARAGRGSKENRLPFSLHVTVSKLDRLGGSSRYGLGWIEKPLSLFE